MQRDIEADMKCKLAVFLVLPAFVSGCAGRRNVPTITSPAQQKASAEKPGEEVRVGEKVPIMDGVFDERSLELICPSVAWWIQFSPDSKRLISGGWITNAPPEAMKTKDVAVRSRYIDQQASKPIGSIEKRLRVWDVASGRRIWVLPMKSTRHASLLLPDFKRMLVAWSGYVVDIYDIHSATRKNKGAYVSCGSLGNWALSPDRKTIALNTYCGIIIYGKNGRPSKKRVPGYGYDVYFGPDGKTLACFYSRSMKPQTFDIATGKQIKHPFWFYRVRGSRTFCFRPDGKILAKVRGQKIEIWTTANENGIDRRLARMTTKLLCVNTMQFSPNGKTLAVAGLSRTKTPAEFFQVPNYAGEE